MKLSEQHLLELKCRLEKYITQREAMIAENQYRLSLGQGIAYASDSFFTLQQQIEALENHICWLGEK